MDSFTDKELLVEMKKTEIVIDTMNDLGVDTTNLNHWLSRVYKEVQRRGL